MQNYTRDKDELLRDAYAHISAFLAGIKLLRSNAPVPNLFLAPDDRLDEDEIWEVIVFQAQELLESVYSALEMGEIQGK